MSSDNTLLNVSSASMALKAGLCVYDFRLHESVASMFKRITPTHTGQAEGWLWGVAGGVGGIPATMLSRFLGFFICSFDDGLFLLRLTNANEVKPNKTNNWEWLYAISKFLVLFHACITLQLADALYWLLVVTRRDCQGKTWHIRNRKPASASWLCSFTIFSFV